MKTLSPTLCLLTALTVMGCTPDQAPQDSNPPGDATTADDTGWTDGQTDEDTHDETSPDALVLCELGDDYDVTLDIYESTSVNVAYVEALDGSPRTSQWTLVDGPVGHAGWVNPPNGSTYTFLVPGYSDTWIAGDYTLRFETWTAGEGYVEGSPYSCADEITVSVSWTNSPPVADAGEDIYATVGQAVTFDGSRSSDVDGDTLSYNWGAGTQPEDSACCSSPHPRNDLTPSPYFTPDTPGDYTFTLYVEDGEFRDSDTVVVHVSESPVVVNPGEDTSEADEPDENQALCNSTCQILDACGQLTSVTPTVEDCTASCLEDVTYSDQLPWDGGLSIDELVCITEDAATCGEVEACL